MLRIVLLAAFVNLTSSEKLDLLIPYKDYYETELRHRVKRECQPVRDKNVAHELSFSDPTHLDKNANLEVKSFVRRIADGCFASGHVAIVSNPLSGLSVLEPPNGGCRSNLRETTSSTSAAAKCQVAVNAGLFNTNNGQCYGNVVSNGIKIQDSGGIQNAHFGILKNGSIFTGYLPLAALVNGSQDFQQLVGGVIWLVRDNKSFVNKSMAVECDETEETGTLQRFVNVKSARTVIGHDKDGRVIIVQVNGWTRHYGMNLWEMADMMIELGAVNAINLDGGGSSTFVVNGSVVNQVPDKCRPEGRYTCERAVTTVICVRTGRQDVSNNHNPSATVMSKKDTTENPQHVKVDHIFSHAHAIILSLTAAILLSVVINILLLAYFWRMKRRQKNVVKPMVNYSSLTNIELSSEDEDTD